MTCTELESSYKKKWRTKVKERMVESMGGCCQICSYNKSQRAMCFHHVNPKEKDFTFGSKSRRWEVIVKELAKCILLCHNCHDELHDGLINLPDAFAKFDEQYREWPDERKAKKKKLMS